MPTGEEIPTGPDRRDERLPKSRRVRKRSEYLRLQHVGRRRGNGHLVVICAKSTRANSRIGITASRRVGNAVTRNRIKRFVREFFRRHQYDVQPVQDILVIARPSAATATYADVRAEIARALGIEIGR